MAPLRIGLVSDPAKSVFEQVGELLASDILPAGPLEPFCHGQQGGRDTVGLATIVDPAAQYSSHLTARPALGFTIAMASADKLTASITA